MRRLLIALGLAACGSGSGKPAEPSNDWQAGAGVALRWQPAPTGSGYDKTKSERAELVYGDQPFTLERLELRHVDVLESGDFPTRVAVQWEQHHEIRTVGGTSTTKAEPVEGHGYVVWRDGDALAATRDDGAEVSPEELEEIADALDDEIGTRPGIVDMLLRHDWRAGETIVLTADDRADLDRDLKPGMTVLDGTSVTMQSTDGEMAVFELVMTVRASGDVVGETDGRVTFVIDVDPLRPMAIDSSIDLDIAAAGTPITGTSTSSEKFTYR